MPPDQPGQALFVKAQAAKGCNDPEYIEAVKTRECGEDLP